MSTDVSPKYNFQRGWVIASKSNGVNNRQSCVYGPNVFDWQSVAAFLWKVDVSVVTIIQRKNDVKVFLNEIVTEKLQELYVYELRH